jgi:hypothetical protein
LIGRYTFGGLLIFEVACFQLNFSLNDVLISSTTLIL